MKRTIGITLLLLCCIDISADGEPLGLKTVVIDPGHGGKDPGCVSKDNKTYEKTITLDIGKTLAERIRRAYPDVKVVMTRDSDVYVTLDERAAIANEANADLFISIHINANQSSAPSGYSVHVLGQSSNKDRDLFANNMDVCIRENSVIMLEDDYNTKYQGFDPANPESYIFMMLMQNAYLEQSLRFAEQVHSSLEGGPIAKPRGMSQDPFYLLWKTAMPAVLLELGFMSNASDLEKLRNKSNRDELAGKIFDAFRSYKNVYDESINLAKYDDTPAPSTTSTYFASTSTTSSLGPRSSSSTLSRGYTPTVLLPESAENTASQSSTAESSSSTAEQTSRRIPFLSPDSSTRESSTASFRGSSSETVSSATQTQITTGSKSSSSSTPDANRYQSQSTSQSLSLNSTADETSDQAPVYYSSNAPSSSSLLRERVGGNSSSSPVYLTPSMALNLEEDKVETRQSEESIERKPAEKIIQAETRGARVEYGIQIFATSKPQEDKSFFLGYTPKVIFDSGIGVYKHFIAISESKEKTRESLNEIRKKYPDAFLVEIRDGTITRVR